MNQAEIISALNAVRSVGQEFTKAFNNLADVVEAMASENESLHIIITDKDHEINMLNNQAQLNKKEVDSSYARALKAEHDGWEVAQTLAQAKSEVDELNRVNTNYRTAMVNAEDELASLRPFRTTVGDLEAKLAMGENTITQLRSEVSKLLEIILNVATSVDSVVNKKEEPKVTPLTPGEVVKMRDSGMEVPVDDYGYPLPQDKWPAERDTSRNYTYPRPVTAA